VLLKGEVEVVKVEAVIYTCSPQTYSPRSTWRQKKDKTQTKNPAVLEAIAREALAG
jgi:hypothetical protein